MIVIEIVLMYHLDIIKILFLQGSDGVQLVQQSQNCLHFKFSQIRFKTGGPQILGILDAVGSTTPVLPASLPQTKKRSIPRYGRK